MESVSVCVLDAVCPTTCVSEMEMSRHVVRAARRACLVDSTAAAADDIVAVLWGCCGYL
jgi:hypothetical protein